MSAFWQRLFSRCVLCLASSETGNPFCPACRRDLPWRTHCRVASATFPVSAALWFEPPVNWLIHAAKFGQNAAICRHLGNLMAELGDADQLRGHVVCPIPIGWRRQLRRGFNQSLLIAEPLAQRFGLRLQPRWLIRADNGAPQKQRGRRARLALAHNAFAADSAVAGQRILLVDDVFTTGATLRAARDSLLRQGARDVVGWVSAAVR